MVKIITLSMLFEFKIPAILKDKLNFKVRKVVNSIKNSNVRHLSSERFIMKPCIRNIYIYDIFSNCVRLDKCVHRFLGSKCSFPNLFILLFWKYFAPHLNLDTRKLEYA